MARNLTASDRSALIKLASTLPKGSPERKAILAGLATDLVGADLIGTLKADVAELGRADTAKELKGAMRSFLFDVVRYLVEADLFSLDPSDQHDDDWDAVLQGMYNVGQNLDKSIRRHMG
jgi:hypothetical protein